MKKEQTLQTLLQEIQGLRESLDNRPPAAPAHAPELHPSLRQLEELLAANEFAADYIAGIRERARREFSLEALENFPAPADRRGGMDRGTDRHRSATELFTARGRRS